MNTYLPIKNYKEDKMKTVNIPAKACPVVDEVDVLVVGGGAAGIGAAHRSR